MINEIVGILIASILLISNPQYTYTTETIYKETTSAILFSGAMNKRNPNYTYCMYNPYTIDKVDFMNINVKTVKIDGGLSKKKYFICKNNIFKDDNNNVLIFKTICADSDCMRNSTENRKYYSGTYNPYNRRIARIKHDEILNQYYSIKVYTANGKTFYIYRRGSTGIHTSPKIRY